MLFVQCAKRVLRRSVAGLVEAGLFVKGDLLVEEWSGQRLIADVIAAGRARTSDGRAFASRLVAADSLIGRFSNGWGFWSVQGAESVRSLANVLQRSSRGIEALCAVSWCCHSRPRSIVPAPISTAVQPR